jgi:hypothetical protein
MPAAGLRRSRGRGEWRVEAPHGDHWWLKDLSGSRLGRSIGVTSRIANSEALAVKALMGVLGNRPELAAD